ncbi:hypothetical protein Rumeso_00565 [Rubellimicrobium mesophilum DSM 19309]|uniref:ABM domain-containing protein n=1 Tax=Rubellimicrobium mesophilum DSM 19309 TaxID=442562 RepID=A0A017HUJ5_9RHOB|nr:antibiotic biosynthesis monooxygenase family protein [Rubellimicrobium mesophilum]EYD77838.1 hypothetical protein Rumeso_00565 [Rubellimicrobium mesophilum DSM 19309]
MYGLINRFTTHPGRRDELIAAMTGDAGPLPGCRSFVVAKDPADPDAVWITEVWDSEEDWRASLDLPAVRASIDKALSLIASFGERTVTLPVSLRP